VNITEIVSTSPNSDPSDAHRFIRAMRAAFSSSCRLLSRSEEAVKGGANCFKFAEFIGAQRRPLKADAAKAPVFALSLDRIGKRSLSGVREFS